MKTFSLAITIFLFIHFSSCSQDSMNIDFKNCDNLYPPLDTIINSHTSFTKTHYPKRIEVFMKDTISKMDIVMLGNSLTELGGNWATRLGASNVKNRGIAGDNCYGVMARTKEIVCAEPSLVFLTIGTNDLWLADSPAIITSNIQTIASILKQSKSTKVYVETIMPVAPGHEMTQKIAQINELLRASDSNDFVVIDTFKEMADANGALSASYTYDGIHLTELAYQKWALFLINYL